MLLRCLCPLEGALTLESGEAVWHVEPGTVIVVDEANAASLLRSRCCEVVEAAEPVAAEPEMGLGAKGKGKEPAPTG